MATITIAPQSQYKTKVESSSYWNSWGSSWTDQSTNDGDSNRYYMGRFTYSSYDTDNFYHWICRLRFTVPSTISISKVNKLILAMTASGAMYITSPKAILSATDCGPNPSTIANDTASHISTSQFYTSTAKSDTFYHENVSSGTTIYLVFDSFTTKLVPGSTYYIYFVPYYYSSQTTISFNDMGFNIKNLAAYTNLTLDYESGCVRIYTGSGGDNGWHNAVPYIYTGSGGENGWHQAVPYIYTGSGGNNGWHVSS